jgi:phage shock protein A
MPEQVGFWTGLKRFLTFYWLRKGLGLARMADEQFTSSAQGISDAYDIQQDRMVAQYRELRDAVAQVEMVIEQNCQTLENLNSEQEELIQKRDGALTLAEQSEAGSEDYTRHASAFERFQNRIDEIEVQQGSTETKIGELEQSMKKHMQSLTDLQAEIEKLPTEKAEQIAEFISNQKIVELNERLQGIQTSMDRGPLDAVRRANRELSAKARISEKLAGTDVRQQDAEYAQVGRGDTAKSKMQEMLAARRAERGEVPAAETKEAASEPSEDERPEI